MLFISQRTSGNTVYESTWNVGKRMPNITERVVTFQADGDELEVIIEALKKASLKGGQ